MLQRGAKAEDMGRPVHPHTAPQIPRRPHGLLLGYHGALYKAYNIADVAEEFLK